MARVRQPTAAHGHDLASGGRTGDAGGIIRDAGGHAGAIGAVTPEIHGVVVREQGVLAGPGLAGADVHEVPAPDVVGLSVTVVIHTGRSIIFVPVGPDGSGHLVGMGPAQVRMVPVHTRIQDTDDDVGIAQGFIPAAHGADIPATEVHVAQIPLLTADARIVGQVGGVHLTDVDRMNLFNLGQGLVGGNDLLQAHFRGKINGPDPVQGIRRGLVPRHLPQFDGHAPVEAFHVVDGVFGCYGVERGDPHAGGAGGFIQGHDGAGFDGDEHPIRYLSHHGTVFINGSFSRYRPQDQGDQDGKQNLLHERVPFLNFSSHLYRYPWRYSGTTHGE